MDDALARILAAIQTDPGDRGLARLFAARPRDFVAACRSIAEHPVPRVEVVTGFFIPTSTPPAFETDGPLGAAFLAATFRRLGIPAQVRGEPPVLRAMGEPDPDAAFAPTHRVAVERSGPAADGEHYTMRGLPISTHLDPELTRLFTDPGDIVTIGIGDGGNEVGMGAMPAELIDADIPNGRLVRCVVPTDYLIVCGVSNWGAYALAAGVAHLRRAELPADWFDPGAERESLGALVRGGPLVDGVRGVAEPTVDGLAWDEYARPLAEIARLLDRLQEPEA